jgi:uroporphyrin-III C-methyltransferase/precorrin-2 dehydrogenase/sirohydrochlorin ferrochelatase
MNAPHNARAHVARIDRLARLPVFYALGGKRAVVAGGNAAATWKVELLSACGAQVEVFTAAPCEELLALANAPPGGDIAVTHRGWTPDDLRSAAIAIGAFDNDDDAGRFATAARVAGVPVNVIDRPAFCDFSFGAIVNRSPLVIAISTDGAAPVFAQAVRTRIEALLPQGLARWAAAASRWRAAVKNSGLSFAARRSFWHLFTARALDAPEHRPDESDFAGLVEQVRAFGAAAEQGSVTTVEAHPDDAGLLTLRTVRALQTADVLIHDEAMRPAILDFARREAQRIAVAPWQPGIDELMDGLAADGKRVVRLVTATPNAPRADASRAAVVAP